MGPPERLTRRNRPRSEVSAAGLARAVESDRDCGSATHSGEHERNAECAGSADRRTTFARMAFALPEYEHAFDRFFADAIHELVGAHEPLLADMDWETTPGATASVFQDQVGEDVELTQAPISAAGVVRRAPIRRGTLIDLWLTIDDIAKQMARGMVKGLIGTLDTVTGATGNVVSGAGKPTFRAMLEVLETIEWSLTDDDELSMPTMMLHPDTLKEMPPATPDELAQIEELKERKLNELLSRRRRRRLS
jgi:hypothetical protein